MIEKATDSKVKPINIYKITNLVNGKCYIGQTVKPVAYRFSQHLYDAVKNKKKNVFHSALRKYGKDNFKHELVLVCDGEMSNYYEHSVMNLFNAHASNGSGYNCANPLDHFRSITVLNYGEDHFNSKLSNKEVEEIRLDVNLSTGLASKKYGVSTSTIKGIRHGNAWKKCNVIQKPVGSYAKSMKKGEQHHNSIVSDAVRSLIKEDKHTNTQTLSDVYGISKNLICSIRGSQPQIAKLRVINDEVAQNVLDNPEIANSVLSKKLGISAATISRIKTGKQFSHLVSKASKEQWDIFFFKQKRATGN